MFPSALTHLSPKGGRDNGPEYADWLLQQIQTLYSEYQSTFLALWNDPREHVAARARAPTLAAPASWQRRRRTTWRACGATPWGLPV
jgi:hypothetical protein